ncbi:MAG: hypothetical protein P8Y13_09860 [Deinococcales bacterium]
MDLTERPATLGGMDGVLVGTAEDGWVWRTEIPAGQLASFLGTTAAGSVLELRSESGVCNADVRRCWVDVGEHALTLRVALQARPVA